MVLCPDRTQDYLWHQWMWPKRKTSSSISLFFFEKLYKSNSQVFLKTNLYFLWYSVIKKNKKNDIQDDFNQGYVIEGPALLPCFTNICSKVFELLRVL